MTIDIRRQIIEMHELQEKNKEILKYIQENPVEYVQAKPYQPQPEPETKPEPKKPKIPTAQEIYNGLRDGKSLDSFLK